MHREQLIADCILLHLIYRRNSVNQVFSHKAERLNKITFSRLDFRQLSAV